MPSELKWELRKFSDKLSIKVTSIDKPANKFLRNQREYYMRRMEELDKVLTRDVKKIDIIVNSIGGSVDSAYGISGAINMINAKHKYDCRILIDGCCYSAATLIAFQHFGSIYITPNSSVKFHSPRPINPTGSFLEKISQKQTYSLMVSTYKRRTHKPKKLLKEWIDQGKRFTAKEAVEIGLCDAIMQRYEFDK